MIQVLGNAYLPAAFVSLLSLKLNKTFLQVTLSALLERVGNTSRLETTWMFFCVSSLAEFIIRSNWAAVYEANMLLSIFQGSLANHLGVDHGHGYSWVSVFVFYSACPAS
jgi:hypothetical protein